MAGAGTSWQQGQLFVDIVDKSGYRSGTSLFGNLATGMARTIAGSPLTTWRTPTI